MDRTKRDYSMYRMDKAKRCIESAERAIQNEDYEDCANRSYYAIFHAIRSILALDGIEFGKHSAVAAYFRKEYIKTGIFPVEFSDILKEAFEIRSCSDYDDFYVISKKDVERQLTDTKRFCQEIENYLQTR